MGEQDISAEHIPISYLNAYAYCPRRFYYEYVLGEMVVNEYVLEGQMLHERVDMPGSTTRDEHVQFRRLHLCAPQLGLTGYCDLIEAETTEKNADMAVLARGGKLYPVEYKKGKMGKWLSDHTQLCAQALALEEVLAIDAGTITHGYLYYSGSSRRDEVALDHELRQRTVAALAESKRLASLDSPPPPITNWRKCRDCSLEPICLPREVLAIQNGKRGV